MSAHTKNHGPSTLNLFATAIPAALLTGCGAVGVSGNLVVLMVAASIFVGTLRLSRHSHSTGSQSSETRR